MAEEEAIEEGVVAAVGFEPSGEEVAEAGNGAEKSIEEQVAAQAQEEAAGEAAAQGFEEKGAAEQGRKGVA